MAHTGNGMFSLVWIVYPQVTPKKKIKTEVKEESEVDAAEPVSEKKKKKKKKSLEAEQAEAEEAEEPKSEKKKKKKRHSQAEDEWMSEPQYPPSFVNSHVLDRVCGYIFT